MSRWNLFPHSVRTNAENHIEVGGCDIVDLAQEFGTPLYVFDDATLRSEAVLARDLFRACWSQSTILYATKAYFSPFLARLYSTLGLGLDVTSAAELEIARRADFPRDKIYLHGNNKTLDEIGKAFESGVVHLVVDNIDEIPLVARLAKQHGVLPQLLLRVSPGVDPQTHRYLTTGHVESKFGLTINDGAAKLALDKIGSHPGLKLVGLHVHIGSQIMEIDTIIKALEFCLDLAANWKKSPGFDMKELCLGGGWGVAYNESQKSVAIDALVDRICSGLTEGLTARGLDPSVRLLVEPGRALVARAGVAIYRVGSIKSVSESLTYAAIDGGMGDNIRPALYKARYTALVANKAEAPADIHYSIAGRYCEQGDILIESVMLPRLEAADLLAVPSAGAYQLPMASNYNLIPRPAVVLVKEGKAMLLRRRETIDDMLACDLP